MSEQLGIRSYRPGAKSTTVSPETVLYPEVQFGGYTAADGTVAFFQRVHSILRPESVVLNVGCGRGAGVEDPILFRRTMQDLRGKVREVIGIDVFPGAAENPTVDRFALIEDRRWPVASGSIDVCLADWVLEHVENPRAFFAEMRRVLMPQGVFCARTTNKFGYVAAAARLIPVRLHRPILSRCQSDRKQEDIFPAFYRCNTVAALRRSLCDVGFKPVILAHEGEPHYAGSSRLAYRAGRFYQRHAPATVRNALFVFARRN